MMFNPLSYFRSYFGRNDSLSPSPPTADEAECVVVIVGGGVIGLSAAYNLARKNQATTAPLRQKIIVLESRSSAFSAASAHNTGCLHYYFPESFGEDITPLGTYSFNMWHSIAQNDAQFVLNTGYRPDSLLPIIPGSGSDEKALPNWIAKEEQWDINWGSRGDPCAVVNPRGIAEWLERECGQMGVEIRTATTAVAGILSNNNALEGLECLSVETGETYVLLCRELVLAAGPWTPALVKTLSPGSTLDLQPSINAGDWVVMENKKILDSRSLAVVFFDEIVHEKLEFAGRNDGTVWVCGRRNYSAELPSPNDVDEPDESMISELLTYSRRFLNFGQGGKGEGTLHPSVLAQGRSFRPSTVSGLPFISEVPSRLLFSSEGTNPTSSGVFICYGHGSYGITLGIGSGKLIVQLVQNEKTDIDISRFKVTLD